MHLSFVWFRQIKHQSEDPISISLRLRTSLTIKILKNTLQKIVLITEVMWFAENTFFNSYDCKISVIIDYIEYY